jgi:hypothetical protein
MMTRARYMVALCCVALQRLVTKVDRGVDIDWQQEEIHACTALLKKYLRDLPQPLFSPDLVRLPRTHAPHTRTARTNRYPLVATTQYSCFMAIHSTSHLVSCVSCVCVCV